MKQKFDEIYMVNGASGESITYGKILKYAVPLAKVIQSQHKEGRIVLFLLRNHQYMAAVYYATLFADVIPLLIDPNSTVYEIQHFMQLVQPYIIFCDFDRYDAVITAIGQSTHNNDSDIKIIIADSDNRLKDFAGTNWNDVNDFQISEASSDSTILLIPTSGSTGLPKATVLRHCGVIAQLPTFWTHCQHTQFPQPTKRALLLSSAQWVTHTMMMISCPVFGVSLVMTPLKPTTEHVLEVIEKCRPTWSLLSPAFLKSLAVSCTSDQLLSLETIIATGAPLTQNIIDLLKNNLPSTAHLGNGMGTTETHSFITMPAPGTSWHSNGKIVNIFEYKIVAEDGTVLNVNQRGELCIKSRISIFRGYYKNDEAFRDTVTPDGWYNTGDVFYRDENEEIYFVERKKFWFKYHNYQIAPEELENIIALVPNVQEFVVCDSPNGPAAAIVLRSQEPSQNMAELINATLSDYKRLRGGVYFVHSLPHTYSGKLKRMECAKLIQNLTTQT